MSLERRIKKGRYCPRDCGRQLRSNTMTNAVSKVDGKQVCDECYIEELTEPFRTFLET